MDPGSCLKRRDCVIGHTAGRLPSSSLAFVLLPFPSPVSNPISLFALQTRTRTLLLSRKSVRLFSPCASPRMLLQSCEK